MKKEVALVLGPRSRVRLKEEEENLLRRYVTKIDPDSGYTNIKNTVNVGRKTVNRILEFGYMELTVAEKIRDFLKALQESEYYKNLEE